MGSDPEINNFYSSNQGGLCKKKDEPEDPARPSLRRRLEAEFQGKLHDARIVRTGRTQETDRATTQRILYAAARSDRTGYPLRVIEHVEGLRAELKIEALDSA